LVSYNSHKDCGISITFYLLSKPSARNFISPYFRERRRGNSFAVICDERVKYRFEQEF
jgi:hypothetical protein